MPMLLRVGSTHSIKDSEKQMLNELITANAAIITNEYIPEQDFTEYFSAADWILLPYRKFRFSSGILANAIGAERPLICPARGWIKDVITSHKIGISVNTTNSSSLALAIQDAQTKEIRYDKEFPAEEFSPSQFIQNLRSALIQEH